MSEGLHTLHREFIWHFTLWGLVTIIYHTELLFRSKIAIYCVSLLRVQNFLCVSYNIFHSALGKIHA